MRFVKDSLEQMLSDAKRKGLTIKKACDLAGIHQTTVSRWRAGQSPRMKQFLSLYEAIEAYNPEGGGGKQ